jgi:ubiquinone/menaquinone biosynthesis C-methylase UbiE
MDKEAAKANQLKTWQAVASGWNRYDERLRRLTQGVTDRMTAGLASGQRVLDIASGVGEPAITAAVKVGPTGSVLGTDLVPEMVAFASARAKQRGVSNIEFRVVDGERIDVPPASFDVVTIRWGLMFMPDPVACLRQARAALEPGGRLVAATWAAPGKNPWAAVPIAVLGRHVEIPTPPPGTPGLFALADGARLRAIIEEAGFSEVTLEECPTPMSDCDSGREYLTYILDLAGPIAALFSKVPAEKREAVSAEIAAEIERAGGGTARVGGVTWIAAART